MSDNLSKVINVDVNEILPNRFQPRIQFNENEILELSDSIKEHGVIQPLVVRQVGDKYEIIAGERRYKASVLAGKDTVPVIVKNLSDRDSAEIALIENVQRKNLTPVEEALSYKKILDMGYTTQEELAMKLGKSQSAIANKVRLLNLSDEVQEALLENKISERHARSLLRLKTHTEQNKLLDQIIKERMTVRKTDEAINQIINGKEGESNMNNDSIFNQGFAPVSPATPTPQPAEPVQPSTPNFDIFGGSAPEVPAFNPVPEPAQPSMPSFDIPQAPVAPEVPAFNPMPEPAQPSTPSFDIPQAPVAPEVPAFNPMPEPTQPSTPSFDVFAKMNAQPAVESEAPVTTPIMDSTPAQMSQPAENTFDFGPMPEMPNTQPASAPAIEPIIITDYTKQYDPVMPQASVAPQVDFKEVINAIRECSNKIEQYGFKIDVEEYDLENLYQAVFKIEK